MNQTYIKAYVPRSWFHPIGIHKVLNRIWHRLPNVSGCLFATFTIDREAMRAKGYGPSQAFNITRDRVRKMFFELRQGVEWKGKTYRIDAEYCTKVEFHDDPEGWPHFHCIWLTKRFVPADMLADLWGFGRTNVKRIKNEDFHYLLKYVCKGGSVPEWVKDRQRLRILQPSRGFMKPEPDQREVTKRAGNGPKRKTITIRERLHKWERLALLVTENTRLACKRVREVTLSAPFQETFDRLILSIALDGRYLGDGKINIKRKENLYPWILSYKQNL